jgi:hypothetical protein
MVDEGNLKKGCHSGDDIMFGLILTVVVYIAAIALASAATKHLVPQKPFDAN